MKSELVVLMGGRVAGHLYDEDGMTSFAYDPEYQEADGTPLSVSMPIRNDQHRPEVVGPWIAGLLPEDDAVLRAWGRRFHVSASSPFQLLSTPVGHDCPGAVRFCRDAEVEELLNGTGSVQWISEDEVGERLRGLRAQPTAWLGPDFTGQFSLAGSQSKTALLLQDGKWGVTSGARATTHILKPPIEGLEDHELNEHLCLEAARTLGMATVRSKVSSFAGVPAIVVERYDRVWRGSELIRVHQEDLCQALSVAPQYKYENEGGPTPARIVQLFRMMAGNGQAAEKQVRSFVEALVWNWLIGGTDAHAKNYSLLLSGSDAVLAPLYDIASTLPYPDFDIHKMKLAMKFGGQYEMRPYSNPFAKAAPELGVDVDWFLDRARQLAKGAPDAIAEAAASPSVAQLRRPLAERLVDAVAERARYALDLIESANSAGG